MSNLAGALLMAIAASSAHEHAMCSGYCADIEKEIDRRIAAALAAKAEPKAEPSLPAFAICKQCGAPTYREQVTLVCATCLRREFEKRGALQARIDRALALAPEALMHFQLSKSPCNCHVCEMRRALKGETT